jgi:hypothetical protein
MCCRLIRRKNNEYYDSVSVGVSVGVSVSVSVGVGVGVGGGGVTLRDPPPARETGVDGSGNLRNDVVL